MLVQLVYVSFLLSLAIVTYFRPPAAFAGLLCLFSFKQWAQSQSFWHATHGPFTNIIVACIVILGVVSKGLRSRDLFKVYSSVGWLVLSTYGWALLSGLWTGYLPGWAENWAKYWPYVFIFAVCGPLLFTDLRQIRQGLLCALFFSSIVVLLILTTSRWQGRTIIFATYGLSVTKDMVSGNPLAIGTLGGTVILLGMLMNFRSFGRLWQLLRYPLMLAALILTIRSGSRGQFFGMLITLALFLPLSRRPGSLVSALGLMVSCVISAALVCYVYDLYATDSGRWASGVLVENVQGRMAFAQRVLGVWLHSNPLKILIGLGNSASFDPAVRGYASEVLAAEMLAELGVIGFIAFVVITVMTAVRWIGAYRVLGTDRDARGVLAALGALATYQFLLSFKQGMFLGASSMFMLFIMISFLKPITERMIAEADYENLIREWSTAGDAGGEFDAQVYAQS